eukprot:jgi/Psemu1/11363/gm1.11363_g
MDGKCPGFVFTLTTNGDNSPPAKCIDTEDDGTNHGCPLRYMREIQTFNSPLGGGVPKKGWNLPPLFHTPVFLGDASLLKTLPHAKATPNNNYVAIGTAFVQQTTIHKPIHLSGLCCMAEANSQTERSGSYNPKPIAEPLEAKHEQPGDDSVAPAPVSRLDLDGEMANKLVATSVGTNAADVGAGIVPTTGPLEDSTNRIETTTLGEGGTTATATATATTVVQTKQSSSLPQLQAPIEDACVDTGLAAVADEVHENATESLVYDPNEEEAIEVAALKTKPNEETTDSSNKVAAKRHTGQGMDANARAMKKMKLEDLPISPLRLTLRNGTAHPSPVYIATGWPHRSPMEAKRPSRGDAGEEHRCEAETNGSANASSSANSSNHVNDDVAHALFTESFDTISACGSAIAAAVHEQQLNADGILSPRQKAHSPQMGTGESDNMRMLSPSKKSKHGRYQSNTNSAPTADYPEYHRKSEKTFSGETSEESSNNKDMDSLGHGHPNHRDRLYQEHSPHSPPQRVVELDGDDHGCGDISPIKFSPPTETSPSHQRDHRRIDHHGYHLGRCERSFPSNDDRQLEEGRGFSLESSFPSDSYEKQHAAEVSFDTSAGGTIENAMYAVDTLRFKESFASWRKWGQRYDSGRGQKYHGNHLSLDSTAPPLPQDLHSPGPHTGYYYPHPPPILPPTGVLHIPDATIHDPRGTKKESSRMHPGASGPPVYKADRVVKSSPIRSERSRYPSWPQQELHYPRYGDETNTVPLAPPGPPHAPYIGAPWTGPPRHSEHRGYPPPQAHLPVGTFYSHQYDHLDVPTSGQNDHSKGTAGARRERVKGRKVAAPAAPPSRDYLKAYHQPPPPPLPPPPISSTHYSHHNILSYVGKDSFNVLRSVRKVIHSDPEDLQIAKRRVESAICALGGYIKDVREGQHSSPLSITNNNNNNNNNKSSTNNKPSTSSASSMSCHIFRRRDGSGNNTSIIGASSLSSRSSNYYRDRFHLRYCIGGHGVSWEVEENPPVSVSMDEEEDQIWNRGPRNSAKSNRTSSNDKTPSAGAGAGAGGMEVHQSSIDHTQKMKYRCKLCGQPKQNHICPYRKSLVRTIGVMVCPAVNSYSSSEPGVLTPALTEMNNFVPYGRRRHISDESSDQDTEASSRDHSSHQSYCRLTPGGPKKFGDHHHHHHHYSPATSSLSTSPHSNHHQSPAGTRRQQQQQQQQQHSGHNQHNHANFWREKALRSVGPQPMVVPLVLRAEHYRVVTPRTVDRTSTTTTTTCNSNNNNNNNSGGGGGSKNRCVEDVRDDKEEGSSFDYPHVPLTYSGRKRLTDTLFYLSQRIPSVMADVASLLRLARERDEWDLAVAEVLTQVVVCIHCLEGDYQLGGLRNYLLKIGIAS